MLNIYLWGLVGLYSSSQETLALMPNVAPEIFYHKKFDTWSSAVHVHSKLGKRLEMFCVHTNNCSGWNHTRCLGFWIKGNDCWMREGLSHKITWHYSSQSPVYMHDLWNRAMIYIITVLAPKDWHFHWIVSATNSVLGDLWCLFNGRHMETSLILTIERLPLRFSTLSNKRLHHIFLSGTTIMLSVNYHRAHIPHNSCDRQ